MGTGFCLGTLPGVGCAGRVCPKADRDNPPPTGLANSCHRSKTFTNLSSTMWMGWLTIARFSFSLTGLSPLDRIASSEFTAGRVSVHQGSPRPIQDPGLVLNGLGKRVFAGWKPGLLAVAAGTVQMGRLVFPSVRVSPRFPRWSLGETASALYRGRVCV